MREIRWKYAKLIMLSEKTNAPNGRVLGSVETVPHE
jgi:hypothetical protein